MRGLLHVVGLAFITYHLKDYISFTIITILRENNIQDMRKIKIAKNELNLKICPSRYNHMVTSLNAVDQVTCIIYSSRLSCLLYTGICHNKCKLLVSVVMSNKLRLVKILSALFGP